MSTVFSSNASSRSLHRPSETGPNFDFLNTLEPIALSSNAKKLLKERFLLTDPSGKKETFLDMSMRVAKALSVHEPLQEQAVWIKRFYQVMVSNVFHPGSRVMANAGTSTPQMANCFVLPLEDDRHAILNTFRLACDIKSHGGGCGFNYSKIRPSGDSVRENTDLACGPTALLKLFDNASSIFRQKGRYESGNMAIINVDHPDVLTFISAKTQDGTLNLTNLSVGISDAFMNAVQQGTDWNLIHPNTQTCVSTIPARELFHQICQKAWQTGDPGVVYLDTINRDNPLFDIKGPIEATNTCGEIGLYPYESCNLGYLNLVNLFQHDEVSRDDSGLFDWSHLRAAVHIAVRMIDNSISASWFPVEEINESVRANRRVGLGVTGWADCLSLANIPYGSERSLQEASKLAQALHEYANEASRQLAREKGGYPNGREIDDDRRNIALLALPPSGNNAVIFDTSFSIEPHFSLSYTSKVMGGETFQYRNKYLLAVVRELGLDVDEIFSRIEEDRGSVQSIEEIPQEIRASFKIAHEISPDSHLRMQATFQRYVDNAVTKTVNLMHSATVEDVEQIFIHAWTLGCKGVTVYRDQSKSDQTISFGDDQTSSSDARSCEECIL